jgi:hypothetical protein
MPLWLTQAVALIIKYGKTVPWRTVWAVIIAIGRVQPTVEKNLTGKEKDEFYGLIRKARAGPNKARPWRNLAPKERTRVWELARKAAGFGK